MLDLLKSALSIAKDSTSVKLPDWLEQFFAAFLFLACVVIASGIVYYNFAIQSLPSTLRVELSKPTFRVNDYILYGLDSFREFIPGNSQLKATAGLVVVSVAWLLINSLLGLATALTRAFYLLLRGRFDDPFLKMDETKQRKAEEFLEKLREDELFMNKQKEWQATLVGIMAMIIILRGVFVLLPLLVCTFEVLMVNLSALQGGDLVVAVEEWLRSHEQYTDTSALMEPLRRTQENLWLMSGFCLSWTWITFRYSLAGRIMRSALLLLATVNILFLAGRIGESRGLERIQLRKITIEASKLNSIAELRGTESLFLREDEGRILFYSCGVDRVISIRTSDADLVLYGVPIGLGKICSRQ